ncbi:MAG: ribosomal protein S18-alanine N-acetyltransferase [Bryobacteraceae bacterium]|nr:ribosomal protein S18-alanine N-acetyltransferase [Bryobacteraceae bacterium]MDW8378196.1 ribosomal protein S18-alanine N-acetyltransferase [Bryobacterales bacterium]
MKQWLKRVWFGLLGKDPEAVVVTFGTGSPAEVLAMLAEIRSLLPERRHFLVSDEVLAPEGVTQVRPAEVRQQLRRFRIGMAAVLFNGDRAHTKLRLTAFFLAPTKILAYNSQLERHHLRLRSWLASALFLAGIPLDRIWLRPRWLAFATRDRTVVPNDPLIVEGRPPIGGRRRVGILTPFLPYPLSHGGAVRLFHLIRALARQYNVYLFSFRETETRAELQPLLEFCTMVATVTKPRYREPRWSTLLPPEVWEYESRPMRQLLARLRAERNIDYMQIEFTQLARYPGDVLVEHDVTFDLYAQLYRRRATLASWWDWWRWCRFEKRAVKKFRRVVVMSEKDARLLSESNVTVIPNGVDVRHYEPAPEPAASNLLFIGSFRHFPNVMAFHFLWEEVWPLIRRQAPEAKLTVVAGPDPELNWKLFSQRVFPANATLAAQGVEFLGFVADVRPLYRNANIVLVPTLVSAGTNVKVLEAMAMERAVVSTPSGAGGLDLEHGEEILLAEGAENFAQATLRLLEDAALRRRLAVAARRKAERLYDWSKLGQMQCSLVDELSRDPVLIRKGGPADLEAVRAIQREALPSSKWDAEHYLRHEFYVALWKGAVVGFIAARNTAPDEREILNVAVAASHRGRGLGSQLIRRLLESGKPGEVFLEVRESNVRAQALYRRLGFREVGRRPNYYDDPPETAVIMRAAACRVTTS